MTPHTSTTKQPSSLSSCASMVLRSPSSTPPASFSRAPSLCRTVHELQDLLGRAIAALRRIRHTSAEPARGGSSPAVREPEDGMCPLLCDCSLQIRDGVHHAQARRLIVCTLGCGARRELGSGMCPLQFARADVGSHTAAAALARRARQQTVSRAAGARARPCTRHTCTAALPFAPQRASP